MKVTGGFAALRLTERTQRLTVTITHQQNGWAISVYGTAKRPIRTVSAPHTATWAAAYRKGMRLAERLLRLGYGKTAKQPLTKSNR